MTESILKSHLRFCFETRLPSVIAMRIEDKATGGIPDFLIVSERSVFLEIKHANPYVRRKPLQETKCMQLHAITQGRCWYVIYVDGPRPSTEIVHPMKFLEGWKRDSMEWERRADGFNHNFVVDFVRELL
jgi:hypothetical protein